MASCDLKTRTRRFALEAIRLFRQLPRCGEAQVIGRQLLRSATSVAANYRASQRARSKAEFIAKLGIVLEEADETLFWTELMLESATGPADRLAPFAKEANELVSIFVASLNAAKR